MGERMQSPAHGGARQFDEPGNVTERELSPLAIERLQDAQAARERFQEVGAARRGELLLGGVAFHARHGVPLIEVACLSLIPGGRPCAPAFGAAHACRSPASVLMLFEHMCGQRTRISSMLSAEQNDLVTRTGPGTAAGQLMRRYWQPAALVDELAGNRPVKA